MILDPRLPEQPFPGLRPFEREYEALFFGREQHVDDLIRHLRRTRFLAVVGTSGSGKSSLVRAGLIPRLEGGATVGAGRRWRIALMRPGKTPLAALVDALERARMLGDDGDPAARTAFARVTLEGGVDGLNDLLETAPAVAGDNVLIVVDQFEELFRYADEGHAARLDDEAAAFVRLLLAAAATPDANIYVAITMRSDFIGEASRFRGLPEVINESLYLVPRLTREQMRAAIEAPLAVLDIPIEPRLVTQVLNDVGDEPDQLPVLQHALMRTWVQWRHEGAQGPLDLDDYDATGGLSEALSKHGDDVIATLSPREQFVAERLFKALTTARGIRRPLTFAQARAETGATPEELDAVVGAFAAEDCAFLMPPANGVIDLSHESVMRLWKTLVAWVAQESREAQEYDRLRYFIDVHTATELLEGPELTLARVWRERFQPEEARALRYGSLADFEAVRALIDRSVAAHQIAQQRRTYRILRAVVGTIVAAATLWSVFGMVAVRRTPTAELCELFALVGLGGVAAGVALLGRRNSVVAGLSVIVFGALAFGAASAATVDVAARNITQDAARDPALREWAAVLPPLGRRAIERATIANVDHDYNEAVSHEAGIDLVELNGIGTYLDLLEYLLGADNGHVLFFRSQISYVNHKVAIGRTVKAARAHKPLAEKDRGSYGRTLRDSTFDPWNEYIAGERGIVDHGNPARCWQIDGYCSERAAWAEYIEAYTSWKAAHETAAEDPDETPAHRLRYLQDAYHDLAQSVTTFPKCVWLYDPTAVFAAQIAADFRARGIRPPSFPRVACDKTTVRHDPFVEYVTPAAS